MTCGGKETTVFLSNAVALQSHLPFHFFDLSVGDKFGRFLSPFVDGVLKMSFGRKTNQINLLAVCVFVVVCMRCGL